MKGERVTLTITGTGMDGEGVARLDNLAVFVNGAMLGEVVDAIIYERKKNFARARVIKVLQSSPNRIKPLCSVYYNCGGCNMQHIEYSEQLRMKKAELVNCLKKALRKDVDAQDVVPSNFIFNYRNKLQLPIGELNGKIIGGFYKDNTHTIVPITACPLHGEWADKIIRVFLEYCNGQGLSAYNEITHSGLVRHLVARKVNDYYSIVVVINGDKFPNHRSLTDRLRDELGESFSLYYSPNRDKTNVIMGDSIHLLYGKSNIDTEILGLNVSVSPYTFMQVNDYIRDKIYSRVKELVQGDRLVIDAYSGSGLMTAIAGLSADKAIGIEIITEAVIDANNLVERNNLNHRVVNIAGATEKVLPELLCYLDNPNIIEAIRMNLDNEFSLKFDKNTIANNDKISYNMPNDNKTVIIGNKANEESYKDFTLILDPPRKGCDPKVISTILETRPSKLIYISCNPATLARDLALLTQSDTYAITTITPYDMFPQTSHLETLICLKKKEEKQLLS